MVLKVRIMSIKVELSKKQEAVDKVFLPDKSTGVSEWKTKEEIQKTPELNWGNNGHGRHGVYFGDNRYAWETQKGRGITHMRTNGFNLEMLKSGNRPIRQDIENYHKSTGCVVCGSKSDLTTDHKNDLYNDPRVLDARTQTRDDFQCLCRHCNLLKRQICKKTKETGKRYGATNIIGLKMFGIDFIEGDETFDAKDSNAMVGTYWYDVVAFMEYVKNFLESR